MFFHLEGWNANPRPSVLRIPLWSVYVCEWVSKPGRLWIFSSIKTKGFCQKALNLSSLRKQPLLKAAHLKKAEIFKGFLFCCFCCCCFIASGTWRKSQSWSTQHSLCTVGSSIWRSGRFQTAHWRTCSLGTRWPSLAVISCWRMLALDLPSWTTPRYFFWKSSAVFIPTHSELYLFCLQWLYCRFPTRCGICGIILQYYRGICVVFLQQWSREVMGHTL